MTKSDLLETAVVFLQHRGGFVDLLIDKNLIFINQLH
jgi:hypothetical protein